MKVKATREVHIRAREPWVRSDNKKGVLYPGFEIEVVEVIESNAQVIDNNGKWYKDKNGDFYWSGAFYELSPEIDQTSTPLDSTNPPSEGQQEQNQNKPFPGFTFKKSSGFPDLTETLSYTNALNNWWIHDYGIKNIWENYNTMGEGCNILVLDTGYAINNDLANTKQITGWNFKDQNDDFDDENNWHGSKVTSVINSYHPDLLGIAPGASVFMAKGSKNGPRYFLDAFEKATQSKEIDIIVICYSYLDGVFGDSFREPFRTVIEKNSDKLILASSGNYSFDKKTLVFPAMFQQVISVGAVNRSKENKTYNNTLGDINVFAPGEDIQLLDANNSSDFAEDSGTSFATPYVAGVLALFISYIKANHSPSLINQIDFLEVITKKCDFHFGKDSPGIINPIESFEYLITKLPQS